MIGILLHILAYFNVMDLKILPKNVKFIPSFSGVENFFPTKDYLNIYNTICKSYKIVKN